MKNKWFNTNKQKISTPGTPGLKIAERNEAKGLLAVVKSKVGSFLCFDSQGGGRCSLRRF